MKTAKELALISVRGRKDKDFSFTTKFFSDLFCQHIVKTCSFGIFGYTLQLMKNLITALAIATTTLLFSCHDEEANKRNMEILKESVFKAYPTVAGVSVEVKDWHELYVVVRSRQLYSTNAENKQKVTSEIGKMADSIFGTNNELDKGQVIFTKDERSTDMNPSDAQKYPFTFPEK
jgi:hypothetical protein